MNDGWTSADIDQAVADLKAAGWIPKTPTLWRHPSGKLYVGPAAAWKVMQREKNDGGQMLDVYGIPCDVQAIRTFDDWRQLGAGYDLGDPSTWYVYDRKTGSAWHKHCGPYSTFEGAKAWIMGIREA